ncbi:exophilin-5 [Heteronotia binoei]|uniref:exophilin-5 n=1 Tax=Heteronotia binoei TaxID=13085 RepID=UPI00292F4005|nr:exophilin-5 [Heteronotia binoei]
MARAARAVDLSFLKEEEAEQIFHVLERDSRLRRAEKERISKLHKKKEDITVLPGATGKWFEEIQRRKFQNETDVSKMIKQPLAHRLRKAIKPDSTAVKPSTPQNSQAQKNGSPSILGGLRTPFASLFSSFRKPKRQPLKPPSSPPQQHHHPPRYDRFAPGRLKSSKLEEMAKTETCNSPLATKLTNKRFDGKQPEVMEDTSTWNEQLEKELLRVLGSLDEQLAQEQAQGPAKRRTTTDYGCRTSDSNQYPTVTRQSFQRGIQRNERSMFLPDGTRTLRAREEHPAFFRPRTLYDTYMKKYHVEDYANQNVLGRRSPVPKRWCSTHSLGHSSEGSLENLSGLHGSGFRCRDFPCMDTVSRSYSLSSLSRRQSSGSVDLSSEGLQHPLAAEGNKTFTQRNYRHHSKRTPLSSIIWNTPHSSENPLEQDRILRTQSLMDFGPKFEDMYPCSPWDNTKYEFYRSNLNHRRAIPNASHPSRAGYPDKFTDSVCFENWENYALCQPERNTATPRYRYSSLRGRTHLFHKRFPSGRMEEQLLGPDSNQYYNDDPFLTCDADFKRIPANPNDWQTAHAKNIGVWQRESEARNNVLEHLRNTDRLGNEATEEFLKSTKGIENRPMYTSTVPLPFIRARASNQPVLSDSKGPAKYAAQRQHLFTRGGQILTKPLVAHTQTKEDFQTPVSEELRDTGQSSRVGNGDLKEGALGPVSGEVDTNHPTKCPPKNSSAAVPQTSTSFKPPVSLDSNMQAKSASSRETEKMYLSSTQYRNRPIKENDHALKSDLGQMSPPRLSGYRTRDSFFQSLQRGARHSESLRISMPKKPHENIHSSGLGRAWKGSECDGLSDPCTEKSNKHSSFVRHATSNSITGSPSSSPPKSPVTYFTVPRKSASIDGSVISKKPLSSPRRRVQFENQAAIEDNLETLISNRNQRSSWNQRDPVAFASPAHSLSLKDVTCEGNIPQTKGHHPDHPLSATDKIVRKSEKSTITCCLDKTETTVLSDCEETDAGNPLQKCKTTSMVTVSVDEDNIKYHELISVYYTLPRKHSRKLCNLFLDDSSNVGSSPPSGQSPSKKCAHTVLEAAGFPCNSEKEDLPAETSVTPGMSQNSKIPDETNKKGPHFSSPIVDSLLAPHSQFMGSNRKEAPEQLMDAQALSGNRPLSLSTSNLKIPLGNVAALSSTLSTRNAQKENPLGCQPLNKSTVSNNPHITSDPATDAQVSSMEEKIRREAKVKERARHICHILALHSKKGNGLQPRNESVTSGVGETLTSGTTAQSHSENQTLQVEAAAIDNPSLQPNTPVTCLLKSPKSKQEQVLQNNPIQTVCTSSELSESNSVENQNLNSEGQLSYLPDGSTTENNLTSDNAQDKASETEKRKNRTSIKNKLAAMCKTNRKFSSKKNVNPKPHISSIFSQNDTPSSEMSEPLLISSVVPQSILQTGNENQNQSPQPGELENKKSQTHEGPLLVTNENRRPFANLCNQKRETDSSRHIDKRVESSVPNPSGLCQKEKESTLNNSQAHDEPLENINCPTVSKVTAEDLGQKKKDVTTIGESSLFSPSFDKNLNNLTKNYSKANICPQQKAVPPTEYNHYQNVKPSNRLKSQNLPLAGPSPSRLQRERHFSESSYTREPHRTVALKSNSIRPNSRKFNSYSELLSCNENENWEAYSDPNRTFGSRHLMYPSVEFGIFGKEQQQAFLDNIKRSLTEGRLWRPCLLKNPGFLRKEEVCSLNKSEPLGSSFPEINKSKEGSSERKPVEAGPVDSSDSDSDTTTDDEYYPNEHDKESEL